MDRSIRNRPKHGNAAESGSQAKTRPAYEKLMQFENHISMLNIQNSDDGILKITMLGIGFTA